MLWQFKDLALERVGRDSGGATDGVRGTQARSQVTSSLLPANLLKRRRNAEGTAHPLCSDAR
ncbi:MAG: hypothetical protein KME13_22075 [Myxacorys californica WJT36-NPBG1]|nr:hypothetical protein [Myxacorys californica WJT36-NPBG1]